MSWPHEQESGQRPRKRYWTTAPAKDDYALHVFDLASTEGWGNLLDLNGGASAPCIIAAPGKLHKTYMCCLVLRNDDAKPKRKNPKELQELQQRYRDERWVSLAPSIAIVVPIAFQSGIAMAQGIKRLDTTCPCPHLKGLGMALLANVVRRFRIDYLFMSPISSFAEHVKRELVARNVPFGRLGRRSLWWAVTEGDEGGNDKWLTFREGVLNYSEGGRSSVYYLNICPQSPFQAVCPPRTLLLNKSHYVPPECSDYDECSDDDPRECSDDEPEPDVDNYETHDFLWFLAGDGVLVIHGPSLATMVR